jgi:hypothetical protein
LLESFAPFRRGRLCVAGGGSGGREGEWAEYELGFTTLVRMGSPGENVKEVNR